MNPETLEQLLIDAHLGELSPEASELLDAFIDCNPVLAGERDRIRNTLDLAGRAVRLPHRNDAALPPLPKRLIPRPTERHRRFGTGVRYAALAAAIPLAFLLGKRLNLPSSPPSPEPRSVAWIDYNGRGRQNPTSSFWNLSPRESGISRHKADAQHIDWPAPFVPLWKGERS